MAQFQASIAQRFKQLSHSIITRALGLYAWFRPTPTSATNFANTDEEQSDQIGEDSIRQVVQPTKGLTDEQARELQNIVNNNLSQIHTLQKRYSKRGYRIKIE